MMAPPDQAGNPCQSSPSSTILVPLWFIIISLVFFYLSKLLFSGFLRSKDIFLQSQNNWKCRDWVPLLHLSVTLPTLKFKAQPINAFFATVNQMFGGSFQLPPTAERCFVVWFVLNDLITARQAVVGSWEEPPNIWLTVAAKSAFVG